MVAFVGGRVGGDHDRADTSVDGSGAEAGEEFLNHLFISMNVVNEYRESN